MTLEDAAAVLEMSAATLSRIETGIRIPRARDVRDLVVAYGVTDERRIARLTALVAEARETGWWESYSEVDDEYATYIGLEAAASSLQEYAGSRIPGPLQTPDYGRAYLRDAIGPALTTTLPEAEIEKRVEVRGRRQLRLDPGDLVYAAVIDESALRRPVGGTTVMREQVGHLIDVAARPNVTIRVLPFDGGAHPGQEGRFTIVNLPTDAVSDVVYVESLAGQIFIETPTEVERYRRVFETLSRLALPEAASLATLHQYLDDLSATAPGGGN
jgi:transcriptional regulator with XRE-family HTH domain